MYVMEPDDAGTSDALLSAGTCLDKRTKSQFPCLVLKLTGNVSRNHQPLYIP